LAWVALLLLCPSAQAQYHDSPLTGRRDITRYGISGIDAYGNATAYWLNRRQIGAFQTEGQALRTSGYQAPGRLPDRRPMFYDMQAAGFKTANLAPHLVDPDQLWRERVRWNQVFEVYGGFGQRTSQVEPPNTQRLLRRSNVMFEALGNRGPVERATLRGTTGRAPIPSLGGDPQRMLGLEPPPTASEPLSHFVDERMAGAHTLAVAEGWEQFAEDNFHEARRRFAGAVALRPDDHASRIGALFSHLALQHLSSARQALRSIATGDSNPFRHELNVAERLGAEEWPQRLRTISESYAQVYLSRLEEVRQSAELNEEIVAEASALHVFVLWYLGFEDEARAAGNTLARSFPDTVYAQWPALMQAARAAPPAQP